MKLADLHTNECGVIVKVAGHGGFRKRIIEMGFVKGKTVRVVHNAPLRDPIEYEIMGYKISLRREEARLVEVIGESEAKNDARLHINEELKSIMPNVGDCEATRLRLKRHMARMADDKRRTINVALVGNPNCGKTSLFNIASGGHEHVGNYSGVTVDAKEGNFSLEIRNSANVRHYGEACGQCAGCGMECANGHKSGKAANAENDDADSITYNFRIVDLPGTYSLSAYSPEELYVRRHLIEDMPDVVVNVVDSSNLERNLYLTTQLVDMHQRMVVALNMYDELEASGDQLDTQQLGHLLGVPMVPTVSRTGRGIRQLFEKVVEVYEHPDDETLARHIHINHGAELEQSIDRLKIIFQKDTSLRSKYSTRYLAIKFLEGDTQVQQLVETLSLHDELVAARFEESERLSKTLHETPDNALTDAKYGYIQGALKETFRPHSARHGRSLTERIDDVVTNRYAGFPIFFAVLFFIFYITFQMGQYPMEWIDWTVGKISEFVSYSMPDGMLKDMITDGAISGVGSVIVFLPNILILYFFISLLEDTGYMARAAFIMDKLMHHMGLHGKSFIPMVMGFGCNVPAIMATRTVENPKSRLITMLVTPFMSCSARIPIYMVLISAFFPRYGAWMMLSLYALGIIAAVFSARIMNKFLIHGEDLPFVMELPPYRLPTSKSVLRHTWEKGRQYLRKMGGIILVFSLIIWALNYFPQHRTASPDLTAKSETSLQEGAIPTASEEMEDASYLQRLGRFVSPVFSPMGFDWRMSVGIISGVGAKELVVSTLAVMIAGEEDIDTDNVSSDSRLSAALRNTMSPEAALAYLVFVLFYFPCIATITAIKNESGGWKWAVFAAFYTTAFAWMASFITYHVALWI